MVTFAVALMVFSYKVSSEPTPLVVAYHWRYVRRGSWVVLGSVRAECVVLGLDACIVFHGAKQGTQIKSSGRGWVAIAPFMPV